MKSTTLFSADNWKKSKTFQKNKQKETQRQYYARMNACVEFQEYAGYESKVFGSITESFIVESLELGPRTCSENDGTRKGIKIEIKAARYWAGKDECVWQHLELKHDYDMVLFVLLDFHEFKVWAINKKQLVGELLSLRILTRQGNQGYWVKKSDVIPYSTPITSICDLDTFIDNLCKDAGANNERGGTSYSRNDTTGSCSELDTTINNNINNPAVLSDTSHTIADMEPEPTNCRARTPELTTSECERAIHGMRKDAGAKNEQRRTSYSRNAQTPKRGTRVGV